MKEELYIDAQAASGTIDGPAYPLGNIRDFSFHNIFSSATLGGTLSMQASNDGLDWCTADSKTIVSGTSHMFNGQNQNYKYVRLKWVPSGGTGTLTSKLVLKENYIKGV